MLRVGLTGGIASGKTTVAGMLADLGAAVVDADRLAHRVLAPGGAAHAAVVESFGRQILDADGRIDRARLGRRVFGDPVAREALNALVHPAVRAEAARRFAACERAGRAVVVFDAALLVETGAWRDFDRLVVVRASPEVQLARLRERGFDAEQARARLAAQAPLADKLAVADHVIDTDVGLDETRRQVEALWRELLRAAKSRGAGSGVSPPRARRGPRRP